MLCWVLAFGCATLCCLTRPTKHYQLFTELQGFVLFRQLTYYHWALSISLLYSSGQEMATQGIVWPVPILLESTVTVNYAGIPSNERPKFLRERKLDAVREHVSAQPAPSYNDATGIYTVEGWDWYTWQVARWGKPIYFPKETPAAVRDMFNDSGMRVIFDPKDLNPNTKEDGIIMRPVRDNNHQSYYFQIRYEKSLEQIDLPKFRIVSPCPRPPLVRIIVMQPPPLVTYELEGRPDTRRVLPAMEPTELGRSGFEI